MKATSGEGINALRSLNHRIPSGVEDRACSRRGNGRDPAASLMLGAGKVGACRGVVGGHTIDVYDVGIHI